MSARHRTDEEKRQLIARAHGHNAHARAMASCNQLYMGSMATALLFRALGAKWPDVSLDEAIKAATSAQLDAGMEQCANILKHMGVPA